MMQQQLRQIPREEMISFLQMMESSSVSRDQLCAANDAIEQFNKFSGALKTHVRKFVSRNTFDESFLIKSLVEFFDGASQGFEHVFVNSEWSDETGILKHIKDSDMDFSNRGLLFRPQEYGPMDSREYDPHFRVKSELILQVERLDPRFGDALAQQVYVRSTLNLFVDSPFKGSMRPFEVAVSQMKNVDYIPVNPISEMMNYRGISNNDMYDFRPAVLANIPVDMLETIGTNLKLRSTFLYYLYKAFYVSMTDDLSFEKHYTAQGVEDRRGHICFPSTYPSAESKDNIMEWAHNIRTTLFEPLLEQMNNTMQIKENFRNFLGANGDTTVYADNGRWHDAIYRFKGQLETIAYNMVNDKFDQFGIFCSDDIVKFLTCAIKLDLNGGNDTVVNRDSGEIIRLDGRNYQLYGTLASRYSHCPNGRMEGTITAFALIFESCNSNSLDFAKLMKVASYLISLQNCQEVFNFKSHHEEATYFGYVLYILGNHEMLGFRRLGGDAIPWRKDEILEQNFISKICSLICTSGVTTQNAQSLIAAARDGISKSKAQVYCDFLGLLHGGSYTYEERIKRIADRMTCPLLFIDRLMKDSNRSLADMILRSYQERRRLDGVNVLSLVGEQKKAMLFDAFVEFGLFTRDQ